MACINHPDSQDVQSIINSINYATSDNEFATSISEAKDILKELEQLENKANTQKTREWAKAEIRTVKEQIEKLENIKSKKEQEERILQEKQDRNQQKEQEERVQSGLPYKSVVEVMDEASDKEKIHYSNLPLEVGAVDDREVLIRTDIDFLELDSDGKCALDRMLPEKGQSKGYLVNGRSVELHHLGQGMHGPLAELTQKEHRGKGNFKILHDLSKPSEIDHREFEVEKQHFWKVRAQDVIEKEILAVLQEKQELKAKRSNEQHHVDNLMFASYKRLK